MPSVLTGRRTAAVVAVALAAALMSFAFIVSASSTTLLTSNARASVGGADAVVIAGRGQALSDQDVQDLSALPEVREARPYRENSLWIDRPGSTYDEHSFVLDVPALGGATRLTEGRLPSGDREIAISTGFAQSQDAEVGSTVALTTDPKDGTQSTATVVGVISPGPEVSRRDPRDIFIFADIREQAALGLPDEYAVIYLTAPDGTGTSELVDAATAVMAANQPDATVQSSQETIDLRAATSSGVSSATLILLRILGPVCVVVAAIVIATTFTTLVAKQTRTIGLLRCVGASRRQVRLAVLRAGLHTAVIGSVLGSAAGALLAAVLIRTGSIDALEPQHLTISWQAFALTILVSTLVTLAAILRPAHRAARVTPLIALTGEVAGTETLSRRRWLAAAVGLAMTALGTAMTWTGVHGRILEVTASGAVVLVLGALLALPLIVVGAARLLEVLGGRGRRPVLQLACRNLARNPGRTAATTASLLVSVSVAAAMATGLATLNASMEDYLAAGSPVDVRVSGIEPHRDTAALSAEIEAIDGVETTVIVPTLTLPLDSAVRNDEITVSAIDDSAIAPVIRSRQGLEGLDDDTLIVGAIYMLPEGTEVTLHGPAGTRTLRVHVEEGGFGPVITAATARALTGDGPTETSLWVRTVGDGSQSAPSSAVRDYFHGSGLLVSTSDQARQAFTGEVQRTTVIIGAILALALLITLSGLANTAEVSVIERTREVGVLRATGTGRETIRRLFLTESVLIALLGGVLGAALGAGVGIAGASTMFGGEDGPGATVALPWLVLMGILLISGAVGAVACLRASGRAAAVTPVTALAAE